MLVFTSKHAGKTREVNSAHAQLLAHMEGDRWYDGTVASIDARLTSVTRTLAAVDKVAAEGGDLLKEAEDLRAERVRLSEMRYELLNPLANKSLPSKRASGPLSDWGKRFIATEVRQFLLANGDAIDNAEELDVRANDHAEIKTMQLPVLEAQNVVAHFRQAVARQVKPKREAARQPEVDLSFPADALFD